MHLKAPFDSLDIDLDPEEQDLIKECFKKQADFDRQGKKANMALNETRICGATWKQLWAQGILNYDNKDTKTLKVPLNRKHQLMLMRYIEAETVEKDFIAKGLGNKFT